MWYAQKNLNKPDGMSFDELAETAGLFIVAGAETTSALLGAVTYYLLMNPQVLEKLIAEVRSAFKTKQEITISSVNALPYLLAVLSEAMRIYSPAPGSNYRLTLPGGCIIAGRWVPGNTCVAINQYAAFRSPLNFSRPKEFLPERWLGAPEFENDTRKVLQPFSVGPRNCLGRGLAQVCSISILT
jgi:cytochrome P450